MDNLVSVRGIYINPERNEKNKNLALKFKTIGEVLFSSVVYLVFYDGKGKKLLGRIIIAIILTVLGGFLGSFLEPTVFANSIPLAIMGGFILAEIQRKNEK